MLCRHRLAVHLRHAWPRTLNSTIFGQDWGCYQTCGQGLCRRHCGSHQLWYLSLCAGFPAGRAKAQSGELPVELAFRNPWRRHPVAWMDRLQWWVGICCQRRLCLGHCYDLRCRSISDGNVDHGGAHPGWSPHICWRHVGSSGGTCALSAVSSFWRAALSTGSMPSQAKTYVSGYAVDMHIAQYMSLTQR